MKKVLLIIFSALLIKAVFGQCADPTALAITSTSTSSVSFSFSSAGTSPWQVQYGPIGFQLGNGTTQNITSKTAIINGLSGATTYDLYVRDKCGNQTSNWVGPVPFTTSCSGIMSAPFSTGFESSDWIPSTSISQPGTLASCWDVAPVGTLFSWSVGPPFINQIQTGPDYDHTTATGNGKYIHVGSYGLSNDLVTYLALPKIDLSNSSNPVLEYWYHMFGGGIGDLIVLIKEINTSSWDTVEVLSGQQQFSKAAAWKKSNFSLSAYIADTVEIQFVGTRDNYNPFIEISLDDLYIGDKPSCPSSGSFQVVSSNENSVLLDWDPDSTYHWQIQYGAAGFNLGSGIVLQTSTHPYRILGLTSSTLYDFYLRDSCSATDKSTWLGPITLRTDCGAILAPFNEDFEDTAWQSPAAYGNIGSVDTCWIRELPLAYYWDAGPPFYPNSFTGPSGDHTTGTGKYLMTDRTVNWASTQTSISTPLLNLDSLIEPELTFWYHLHGSNIAGMDVAIDSGNGYHLIYSLVGEQQKTDTALWKEAVINLADYAHKTVKVRFTGKSVYTFTNITQIAIDDFSLHEAPSCPKPLYLVADNIEITKTDISWSSGGAANWMIKYKPIGGTFTTISTSANPYILTNLQSDTEYEVWVRDSCGLNDVSVWSGPLTFRTRCGPIPTPYYENFEGPEFQTPKAYLQSGLLNTCWRRPYDDGYYWETGPPFFITMSSGPIGDHTTGGGKYLVSDLVNFVTRDTAYIYSPQIDLSNLTVPEMAFWYHMFGNGIYALRIEIDSGTGWQLIDTLNGQQQVSKYDAWKERIVDLSAFTNDTLEMRFVALRYTFATNAEIAIDDLHIYEAPNCDKPTNFILKNVRSNQATFSWAHGGATNSTLRYKPISGNYSFVNTTANTSFTLQNLLPDTKYEVWVRDSCSTGDVSLWVGPIVFKTDCTPTFAPYIEDFEGGDWVPSSVSKLIGEINSCWKRPDTTYISWIPFTGNAFSSISGPAGSRTGSGNFIAFNNVVYTIPKLEAVFVSPTVIISNLISPELNFWYHMYGYHTDKLEVYAQYLDGSRTLLHTITGQQHFTKLAPWSLKTIPLTSVTNDTIKIVLKGYKTTGFSGSYNISIDDLEIVDAFCWPPSGLASANATRNSVDVSWQSNTVRSILEYGPSGFPQGQGTLIHNVSTGYQITGLQSFTTYDYYVQDSCRVNNSVWVGPHTFTTYCDTVHADIAYTSQGLTTFFDGLNSHGNYLNFQWDFGDGTTGIGDQPIHSYANANTYNVTLIATDTCGQTDTSMLSVKICNPANAVINYSINGLIVGFDGTSSMGAASYYWNFGPSGIYTNATPLVAFPTKAIYNIYLVVTDSCGGKDTAFLALNLCDKPTALFMYRIISSGGSGMTVEFDGSYSQGANSYTWFFGDGNSDTTSLKPTHTYVVPGLHYQVTLIVEGDCGQRDTMSYKLQDVVSIVENNNPDFKIYPNPTQNVLVVEFDRSLNEPQFTWYDQSGKEYHFPVTNNSIVFEFDLSETISGQYILLISAENKWWTAKVIVK